MIDPSSASLSTSITTVAAVLQAISAIAAAVFACLLYFATKKYVELTRVMALAADAQARQLATNVSAAQSRASLELESAAGILRVYLADLPARAGDEPVDRRFRQNPVWSPPQVKELGEQITAAVPGLSNVMKRLDPNLGWLLGRINEIRATSLMQGYSYERFPWDEWTRRHAEAIEDLTALVEAATRARGA